MSFRLELIRNLFNVNNRKSLRAKKVAKWKTGLTLHDINANLKIRVNLSRIN